MYMVSIEDYIYETSVPFLIFHVVLFFLWPINNYCDLLCEILRKTRCTHPTTKSRRFYIWKKIKRVVSTVLPLWLSWSICGKPARDTVRNNTRSTGRCLPPRNRCPATGVCIFRSCTRNVPDTRSCPERWWTVPCAHTNTITRVSLSSVRVRRMRLITARKRDEKNSKRSEGARTHGRHSVVHDCLVSKRGREHDTTAVHARSRGSYDNVSSTRRYVDENTHVRPVVGLSNTFSRVSRVTRRRRKSTTEFSSCCRPSTRVFLNGRLVAPKPR